MTLQQATLKPQPLMKRHYFQRSMLLLILFTLVIASCTKKISTLIPTWDQGKSYSYKLTYTIKSPQVDRGKKGPSTVQVFQTLQVVSETDASWVVNLSFDRIIKDAAIWDQDAEYRFFPNQLLYEIDVPKDASKSITVLNSEGIYKQIIEFVKDNMEKEELDEIIEETKSGGGIESLVEKDFGFLFQNTYGSVTYDLPVVRDTSYKKKQSKNSEVFSYDKTNKYVVFNSTAVELFTPDIDTIAPFIYKYKESTATTEHKIVYDKESIPVLSKLMIKLIDGGAKVTRLDKDHNTILTGGSITETVLVELLSVK